MATPIEQLGDIDYKILRYLNSHSPCKKEVLSRRFRRTAGLESRLRKLLSADQHPSGLFPLADTSYTIEDFESYLGEYGVSHFRSKGTYSITELGRCVLQDYLASRRRGAIKTTWLVAGWIVTTLIALLGAVTGVIALFWGQRN